MTALRHQPKQRPRHHHAQRGFALAAALWLLAGLAIVVSLVDDAAVTSAERVRQLRERADFTRSALAARAQMIYYVAMAQPQAAGFAFGNTMVLADESPYRIDATSVVRLQDLGGLINLNGVDRPVMERLLRNCGVITDQIPFLIDALEDYTDPDDLQRINGAERDSYAVAGLAPPRNSPLLSVDEMWSVYGWAKQKAPWVANGCARALTVYNTAGAMGSSLNLSTAPPMVLRAAGVDATTANDIAAARGDEQKTVDAATTANAAVGNVGMFGLSGGMVRRALHVTHEHSRLPWVIEYNLVLDFNNEDKPWNISQPVISARQFTPIVSAARAAPWPLASASAPSPSDDRRVLPF